MIFAELQYEQHYSELHSALVEFIGSKFQNIDHGLQGDSWIWIFENGEKVAIDTFSAMKHQVKSNASNREFTNKVIEALATRFQLVVFPAPEIEPHEDV